MLEHVEERLTPEHLENHIDTASKTEFHFRGIQIPEMPHAIREYTSGSKDVNKSLWNHKTDGGEINEHLLSQIDDIHKGLDAGKAPSDDMTVYSGLRRDPQKMTKESGGLLHHPAFISASINPSNALGFALPKNSNPDKTLHVLKIKVRKGQKVGGYVGEHSEFAREQEYLVKANQMLHIHPEHDVMDLKGYDGKTSQRVHIHHAIIMDPHEYEHLGEHAEVQKHKAMSAALNARGDWENSKDFVNKLVDRYMDNSFGKSLDDDKAFIAVRKLSHTHIDKALGNPDLHDDISRYQELQPHHIDKLMDSVNHNINDESSSARDFNILSNLSLQKNLTSSHIDRLLKTNNFNINHNLIQNGNIKLEPHHIDKLIDNQFNDVSKRSELAPHHIDRLIDNAGDNKYKLRNIAKRGDLTSGHIDKLISRNDGDVNLSLSSNDHLNSNHISNLIESSSYSNVNLNLARQPNLTAGHINRLIDSNNNTVDRALSFRKDLSHGHIDKIFSNGHGNGTSHGYGNHDTNMILRNINNNYKMSPDSVRTVLDNHKKYNHSLLDHVLHKQSGGDTDKYKDTEYVSKHYSPLVENFSNLIVRRYW